MTPRYRPAVGSTLELLWRSDFNEDSVVVNADLRKLSAVAHSYAKFDRASSYEASRP